MLYWCSLLSSQDIWERGKDRLSSSIPSNRNWELFCCTSNSTIPSKTFFNATINIWLWKWLRSWCKNCYFLRTSCNSSFKALEEIEIEKYIYIYIYIACQKFQLHKHIILRNFFQNIVLTFKLGVKTGNLAHSKLWTACITSFASASYRQRNRRAIKKLILNSQDHRKDVNQMLHQWIVVTTKRFPDSTRILSGVLTINQRSIKGKQNY